MPRPSPSPPPPRRTRLALTSLLLLPMGLAQAHAAGRLDPEVVPAYEAVELEVDASRADYRGRVEVDLEIRAAREALRLHARDMKVTGVALSGPDGDVPARHALEADELHVIPGSPVAPGTYRLAVDFEAPFNTKAVALYRMEEGGSGYAFTQFEATDARGAFPCFDEPAFKIPWQLTVRVPEGHLAVSNTPVLRETAADGWRTFAFQKTKPLPSYLVALATGPLESAELPGLGVPGRIYTTKGRSRLTGIAAELTPPLLQALERYFGRPYPYEKLDYIAIPEYWPGAMEHPGAITYAASLILLDPESATLSQRRLLAKVIAHELAHQWFGDLVTMEWWDDLWLNESFADWMGDKVTHEVFPRFRMDLEIVDDAQAVMTGDARPTAAPIRRPVTSTDTLLQDVGVQYAKGKAVLGMIEAWIGPEVFRRGVLAYLEENAWGNATSDDLWRALDDASGGRVSRPLATFVEQPGLPLVSVEPRAEGRVRLSQSRFGTRGTALDPLSWKIPVLLAWGEGESRRSRTVLLEGEPVEVDLGTAPGWLYPNGDARGYYRWDVPPETLSNLTARATGILSPAERMDLVGNLSALLESGRLDGGRYLETLQELADDEEPMVVSAVLDRLAQVEPPFVSEDLEDEWAAYVRRSLRPALERMGLRPREGESETTALVRPRLLERLGEDGRDPDVLRFADEQASTFLADPRSVPPQIASVCLRLSSTRAGEERFDLIRKRFEEAEDPTDRGRYLQALGSFRDPALAERALEYAFTGPLRANELFTIPRGVLDTEAGRDRAWRWMTRSYEKLAARLPPEFMGFMPFFAAGCSADRLAAARTFFGAPEHQAAGTERLLARVAAQVDDCLALRAREGETVRGYLETTGAGPGAPAGPPAPAPAP